MRSDYFKKLMWSLDTFEDKKLQAGALAILGALTRATKATVEPVQIIGAFDSHESKPRSDLEEAFKALAEKRLFEISSASDISTMGAGKALFSYKASSAGNVETLIDYAEKRGVDAVVVSTRARTGLPRFFMGSFAETLLLKSTVPVIAVNPDAKIRERISKILMPTTFQDRFRPGFEQVARLAKILDARLTLLYKEPFLPAAYMSPVVQNYMIKEAAERAEKAKEWQAWAAQFHVPVDIQLDNIPGPVVDAIDKLAEREDFDLIAMVTQSSSASVPLIGSVTRQVVRSAPCPVWVVRTEESTGT